MASARRLFLALFPPRRRARPVGTCTVPAPEQDRSSGTQRLLALRRQERALREHLAR